MDPQHNDTRNADTIPLTINIDPAEFFDQAVALAVRQLLSQSSYDEDGVEVRYPNQFQTEVRRQINDAIKEGVVEKAKEIAADILAQPLPKVDRYGQVDRAAGTETLTEKIADEVKLQIMDRAGGRDNYGSRKSHSVLHEVIHKEVQEVVANDLKAEVETARKQVREAVKGKVADLLQAETLRAAGIK